MSQHYDMVIRAGTVVDGTGQEPRVADVAITGGRIAAVGTIDERGDEELDGAGLLVTPGFVDVHTHYDGQVTWENLTEPSSSHGVTTIVTGNCGVGFAPCRPQDRERLVSLMEGVEDIPEIVMTEGLPWTWETFPEYLNVVESRARDVDVGALLPHACLRVYVMGERALAKEPATAKDMAEMAGLAEAAMRAGALGFSTSRSFAHRDNTGSPTPTMFAIEAELQAIADGMTAAGHGILEAIFNLGDLDNVFEMLCRVSKRSNRPVTIGLAQTLEDPGAADRGLELLARANQDGVNIKAQNVPRPTGILLGFGVSYNPFSLTPTYMALHDQPMAQKMAALREPVVRARILSEKPIQGRYHLLNFLHWYDRMFVLGDPPNYTPSLSESVAAEAARRGVTPGEYAYDMMLEDDGNALLFVTIANYTHGNLDALQAMLRSEHVHMGGGDGGAHSGMLCDSGYPTYMLTYWGRDCAATDRISVPEIVRKLSHDTASVFGLQDRGLIKPGYKADVNLIDFNGLKLHAPRPAYDLPAGGRRLKQRADGYVATINNGVVTYRDGKHTGKLPGTLIRGVQKAPR